MCFSYMWSPFLRSDREFRNLLHVSTVDVISIKLWFDKKVSQYSLCLLTVHTLCPPPPQYNCIKSIYRSQFQRLLMYVLVFMIRLAGHSLTLPQYMMIIMKNQWQLWRLNLYVQVIFINLNVYNIFFQDVLTHANYFPSIMLAIWYP